ncbi:DUF1869 domain-containing protein, partial [Klebsiella pneumoniae]|uniref:DUF1869 domain-containing protein n=1 Tax=Klebsiella pneumoniae TaxID=573 RepID=UPI0034D757E3
TDGDGSHGSTSKTPSYTKSVSWHHYPVDKTFSSLAALRDPLTAADAVKDLINIVRGYESDEETNVCGW